MAILEGGVPKKPLEAIEEHFSQVSDLHVDQTKEHKLIDLIAIAICAVIWGAEGWTDVENFGNSQLPWLKSFLELPKGLPSHDNKPLGNKIISSKSLLLAIKMRLP